MNILITGASGFIGASIKNNLEQYHKVFSPSHKDLDLTQYGSLSHYIAKNNITVDSIIHCASIGGSSKLETKDVYDTNMGMFNNVLHAYISQNVGKFINFGSGAEYDTDSYYGKSKCDMLEIGKNIKNYYHLRIYGCFGINELNRRFIKKSLNCYINRGEEQIKIYQDRLFDFVYIDDLISLIKCILNNYPIVKNNFDVTYEDKVYLSDVANFINKLGKYRCAIEYDNYDEGNPYIGNDNIIFNTYVNKNKIGLYNGIVNMYNLMKCHKEKVNLLN